MDFFLGVQLHFTINLQKENRVFSPLDNWISDNEWAINDFLVELAKA